MVHVGNANMKRGIEPASLYELLGVGHNASREEIDQACVNLWYRYQSMRNSPLWTDLSRHIDEVHATLLDPEARAVYDKMLARNQSTGHSGSLWAHQHLVNNPPHRKPRVKFRKVGLYNAVSTALVFNKMVDWVGPEKWADIETIAWLTLFFGLATTLLCWSTVKLFRQNRRQVVAAK